MQLIVSHLGVILGVAVAWHVLFTLNAWLMASYIYVPWASWIFLPAALRIIAVLLFGWAGAAGLAVGTLYSATRDPMIDAPYLVLLALSSGMAPLLAVWLCRTRLRFGENLHGLKPSHIVIIAILGAAANSILSNAVLVLAGRMSEDWWPLVVVFLGDLNGAAIVLFVLSTALSRVATRQH